MRESGILLPVSSLPSKYGAGELGTECFHWMDLLQEHHVKVWQILPLNPLGYGNSPYQPYSSFAGDELYISLQGLVEDGLLDRLPKPFLERSVRVDFDAVRQWKEPFLREAFSAFRESKEFRWFQRLGWVRSYAVYRAFQKANDGRCWNQWPDWQKNWPESGRGELGDCGREAAYHEFLQYEFYRQWRKVKEYAADRGIQIMGDVPFYVGLDSADVWANRSSFLLDEDGQPRFVAGVPPDYFCETGQRWGNPVYDWEFLKQEGYGFWVERIRYLSRLFDVVRIDHFRAFDTYWKIPAACPTAVEGEWVEAPGYEVLELMGKEVPEARLVAEDLGDLRPEVQALRDHYQLKGMKILQFSLDLTGRYAIDQMEDESRVISYSGNHDNPALKAWYLGLSAAGRRKVRRFLKKKGLSTGPACRRLIQYLLGKEAELAVIPLADLMGLGAEARINRPGTVGSPNWEWRLTEFGAAEACLESYRHVLKRG